MTGHRNHHEETAAAYMEHQAHLLRGQRAAADDIGRMAQHFEQMNTKLPPLSQRIARANLTTIILIGVVLFLGSVMLGMAINGWVASYGS